MGAETRHYVNALMLEFRELVLGIQEEQQVLKQKLKDIPIVAATTATTTTTTTLSSSTATSSLTSSINTAFTAAHTASPVDDPSSNTLSSGTTFSSTTVNTSSTRPPPYKSVVKVIPPPETLIVPQPPTRTKRRSQQQQRNINNYLSVIRANTINMAASGITGRGALIVLEGLDRVGKSTLAQQLVEHLGRSRRQVSYHRFPDRTTPVGKLISEYLTNSSKKIDDHTLHLLFSANRWELNKTLRDTINEGVTVIVDRYSYSGIAYSSAKKTLSLDWCIESERGLPKPDLVIYLELSKDAQYSREGFGDERFETHELQELVRTQYEKLMSISKDNWLRVAVENKSVDQVLGEIIIPVRRCLEACANKDLATFDAAWCQVNSNT